MSYSSATQELNSRIYAHMQIDSQVTQIFLLLIEKESFLSKPSILALLQSLQYTFLHLKGEL